MAQPRVTRTEVERGRQVSQAGFGSKDDNMTQLTTENDSDEIRDANEDRKGQGQGGFPFTHALELLLVGVLGTSLEATDFVHWSWWD